ETATPPIWSRSHSAGGVAIVLGDFYTGGAYPSQFDGTLFFTDLGDPSVRALKLDSQGRLESTLFVTGGVDNVVEMTMGPDGRMYYVDITGTVGRLDFTPTASAALASAASTAGPTDGEVAFAPLPPKSRSAATAPSIAEPRSTNTLSADTTSDAALLLLLSSDSSPAQTADFEPASLAADAEDEPAEPEVDEALGLLL
ncbi:MAG: hypothetical protein AAF805_11715, partial [Planctomycetota bacterium]